MKHDKQGCSTCPVGQEQYEEYSPATAREQSEAKSRFKMTLPNRVQYDYRHIDGKLFSTDRATLKECRDERNAWVKKNYPNYVDQPETPYTKQDLEQGILRFITHLDDFGGSYEKEELAELRKLVTVDRPYFPPVEYHNEWTGKTETTEKD